jgi:hypothetical protein
MTQTGSGKTTSDKDRGRRCLEDAKEEIQRDCLRTVLLPDFVSLLFVVIETNRTMT